MQLLLCCRYLKHQATYVDTSRVHPQRWVCNYPWQFHSSKRSGLHVSQRGAIQRAPSLVPERGLTNKGCQLFLGHCLIWKCCFWIKKVMGWNFPIYGRKLVGHIPMLIYRDLETESIMSSNDPSCNQDCLHGRILKAPAWLASGSWSSGNLLSWAPLLGLAIVLEIGWLGKLNYIINIYI